MKILTILNDESEQEPKQLVENMQEQHQVEVVKLDDKQLSYDDLVDKIEQCDKVMSW